MATKTLTKTNANVAVHEKSPIENFLEERFVKYEYFPEFPLSMINEAESLKNQARFQSVIPEVRTRYKDAMKAGAIFPAGIGIWLEDGTVKITDGIHRFYGAKDAKKNGFPFYIIDVNTEPETVQLLTYEANPRLNGQPPSEDERIQHAIHLVEMGATQAAASTAIGISPSILSKSYLGYKADRRAQEMGLLKWWNKLSPDIKLRVNSIESNPPFEAMVKFAGEAKLSNMEAKECVMGLKSLKSDVEKIGFIEEQRETRRKEIQARGAGVLQKQVGIGRHAILMHAGAIMAVAPEQVIATCFDDAQREHLLNRSADCIFHLEKVIDLLTKPDA